MRGWLSLATTDEAAAVVALRNAVAAGLTARHGIGHWSSVFNEQSVRASQKTSSIHVARGQRGVVATLVFTTRKSWAIDRQYFTPVARPLSVPGMAVDPVRQPTGVGRACIDETVTLCSMWPADALCLDAWDADAGTGEFYRTCGIADVGRTSYRATAPISFERLV